jgi:hypothetical protein
VQHVHAFVMYINNCEAYGLHVCKVHELSKLNQSANLPNTEACFYRWRPALTHLLYFSLTCYTSHSLTILLTHLLTLSLTILLTHLLYFSLTYSLTHLLYFSLTYSLTHLLYFSLTYSLTHLLYFSLIILTTVPV